jgi:hypothetical protein
LSRLLWFIAMTLISGTATCANISGVRGTNGATLQIKGDIQPGDERLVREHLSSTKPGAYVHAYVQSRGGDVHAAIEIGRLLRQHEARVSTDLCMSSCVLVLIGGVERRVSNYSKPGWGLGLHRPYFGALSPSLSSSEIAEKRQLLLAEVAAYIKDMNVSSRLLDFMEAIPPEKMRMLTETEVSDLGLDAPDPVWDEKTVAASASTYGIGSLEFRRRRASVDVKCPSSPRPVPSLAEIQGQIDCEESVRWGLGVQEYRSRDKQYDAWVLSFFGDRANRRTSSASETILARNCRIRVMVYGDKECSR